MRCSQKTTWLSYNTVNTEHLQSLHSGLAYRTMCTINQNNKTIHSVLVYHTLLIGLLFLHVNIYFVLYL